MILVRTIGYVAGIAAMPFLLAIAGLAVAPIGSHSAAAPTASSSARGPSFDAEAWDRFYEACRRDTAILCPQASPRVSRIAQCLSDHRRVLSASCYQAIQEQSVGRAGDRLRQACAPDQARLCPGLMWGDDRLASCMRDHLNDVSPACRAEVAASSLDRACQSDVLENCFQSTARDQALRDCVTRHARSVSPACLASMPSP